MDGIFTNLNNRFAEGDMLTKLVGMLGGRGTGGQR